MKKLIFTMFALFICSVSHAQTETMNWYVEGALYDTTTCESGGDIDLPTSPTKYGYTFQGWYPYVPLEYIESTGTQWIEIPCSLNSSSVLEVEYHFLALGATLGAGWFSIYAYNSTQTQVPANYSNYTTRTLVKHIYKFDGPNNTIYIDDKKAFSSTSYSSSWFSGLNKYIVFSNSNKTDVPHSAKFYHLKIWNRNVLVRDMVPALDSNNIACMYDKVSKTFFYNQGTGDFIAGPIKTSIEEE